MKKLSEPFTYLHGVQIGNLALDRFDGLVLVDTPDVHIHKDGSVGIHEVGENNIMANGTRAFAIQSEQMREKDNPLRTAEMTLEDDYGMIDGVINNGRRGEEVDKAKEAAAKIAPDKKPSIMELLEDAKRECAERKFPDKAAPQKKPPELSDL